VQTNHASVGWIGLAVSGAPIANGRGYILIRGIQVNCFVLNQVQTPGGKCVLISYSSISRALWCPSVVPVISTVDITGTDKTE